MATVSRRLDAAFHHAGHAVAAHLSKFHNLALPLRTDVFGTGEVTAALSRSKLVAASKVASVQARLDHEVVASIVTILCAGLACEELASARGFTVTPDPGRSAGDFQVARTELGLAGMSEGVTPYCDRAAELLREHWTHVETIAERLARFGELSPEEIAEIIEQPGPAREAQAGSS